ncbi:MAG: hypothetical protein ABWK01_06315 [Infirmifilum sp.]
MTERATELRKKYLEVLKQQGLIKDFPVLTNEEGRIILLGGRWILMNVEAFPEHVIQTVSRFVGEKLAQEFIYWFGVSYGEHLVEKYRKMVMTEEQILNLLLMISAVITGFGIGEIVEYSPAAGKAVVRFYNDFEVESARLNGRKPTNNFLRGIAAGVASKLWNAKVYATAEYKDGYTLITVQKK